MTLPNDTPDGVGGTDDGLQFDIAEPSTPPQSKTVARTAAAPCAACGQPITAAYYAVGTKPICANCAAKINAPPGGSRTARLGLATTYGIGAAILGAIIWYVIRRVTHLEIGYVAILVGFLVGGAVRKGSGNRGGRAYQVLALILTYCSIGANYAPDLVSALIDGYHQRHPAAVTTSDRKTDAGVAMSSTAKKDANQAGRDVARDVSPDADKPSEAPSVGKALLAMVILVALVAAVSLAAPFLAGFQNVIGLLIIAFALFQAWKMNGRRRIPVTGPYQIGQPRPGAAV